MVAERFDKLAILARTRRMNDSRQLGFGRHLRAHVSVLPRLVLDDRHICSHIWLAMRGAKSAPDPHTAGKRRHGADFP